MTSSLFELCVCVMMAMASLFRTSYERINVVLFDFVEPLLFIMGLANIFFASKGISFAMMGIIGVVAFVFALTIIRIVFFPSKVGKQINDDDGEKKDPLFWGTVKILQWTADKMGTSYELVNLAVYILLMPLMIVAGMVVPFL